MREGITIVFLVYEKTAEGLLYGPGIAD